MSYPQLADLPVEAGQSTSMIYLIITQIKNL